jgi:hypothetical protein
MFTADHSAISPLPQLSALLAAHTKTKLLKSFVCHTCEKIPGSTPRSRPPYRQRVPLIRLFCALTEHGTRNMEHGTRAAEHIDVTLPHSSARKFSICQSYENTRGWPPPPPSRNS